MPFRKKIQTSQLPDLNSPRKAMNSTPSADKAAATTQSLPQTKNKSAWLDAALPQFYDRELAAEMVKQGYYKSLEEAYVDVPENLLNSVRERIEEYLSTSRTALFWCNAPLPSPKK
ncbi:MAG: hypothetical protein ABI970_15240 [Chloroflexota bacterium]|nr:hypothetical protein [Anaerolineae bacterium]